MASSLTMSFLAIAVIVAIAITTSAVEGHTHSDCGVAQTAFGMCVPYVMGDDPALSSQCCAGVQSVRWLSSTLAARRGICDCLRQMMAEVGRIDSGRASGLAGKCGVRTNVIPTSLHYSCFEIA